MPKAQQAGCSTCSSTMLWNIYIWEIQEISANIAIGLIYLQYTISCTLQGTFYFQVQGPKAQQARCSTYISALAWKIYLGCSKKATANIVIFAMCNILHIATYILLLERGPKAQQVRRSTCISALPGKNLAGRDRMQKCQYTAMEMYFS